MSYVLLATTVVDVILVTDMAQRIYWLKILFVFVETFFVAMWLFSNGFQLIISILIYHEFKLFRILLTSNSDETFNLQKSLEAKRRRFIQMLRIVKAANNMLSLRQVGSLGCNVITVCLLLYLIAYFPDFIRNLDNIAFCSFWFFICTIDIFVSCMSGILITTGVSYFCLYLTYNSWFIRLNC